ncbi:MAG: HAMP domain-containing protein [Bacteroidetes bacterium]|nr:HAMP domain-containing protein [Bacteroidota bacterium]
MAKNKRKQKIINYSILVVIIIFLLQIFSIPYIIKSQDSDWSNSLEEKIQVIEFEVLGLFNSRVESLSETNSKLLTELGKLHTDSEELSPNFFVTLENPEFSSYSIQIYDVDTNLVAWNETAMIDEYLSNHFRYGSGEAFFRETGLYTILSIRTNLSLDSKTYYCSISNAFEKQYYLQNEYYTRLSFTEELSELFNTRFDISYTAQAQHSRDGRVHSFDLLNNFGNKVGIVDVQKPSKDYELNTLRTNLNSITSIIVMLLALLIYLKYYYLYSELKYKFLKFFVIVFSVLGFRSLIFFLNIPSQFLDNDLLNASYFSSVFAFGMVRSPLEFFITAVAFLIVCVSSYYMILSYLKEKKKYISTKKNKFQFLILSFLLLIFYLFLLRGFSASVNSIVFDSSLRYFRDPALLPELPAILMHLNLLLLGFCAVLFGTIILIVILNFLDRIYDKNKFTFYGISFFCLQLFALLFDVLQNNPQGTDLSRSVFVIFTFVIAYLILQKKSDGLQNILLFAFTASFMSINLLSFYNSELERESLKLTAYEIVRPNENYLEYTVFQTLNEALAEKDIPGRFNAGNINYAQFAFKIWSRSLLQKEAIPSQVAILDEKGNLMGKYNFEFPKQVEENFNFEEAQESIQIIRKNIGNSQSVVIDGIVRIYDENEFLGYVEVSVLFNPNQLSYNEMPPFLTTSLASYNTTVDLDKLRIFDFHNGRLVNSVSNLVLSEEIISKIIEENFSEHDEKWMTLELNGEKNLFYVLKNDFDGLFRIITVVLEEKNISWNLYDFFKVFFIQTLFILLLVLAYTVVFFYRNRRFQFTFRTQLLFAFILLSMVPSILLAVYYKDLTQEKNDSAIFYKLSKRADGIESYLQNNYNENMDANALFEKAKSDLGISFSLFDPDRLKYSSEQGYYDVGLLENYIDPVAYKNLSYDGLKECVINRKIENYEYSSYYTYVNYGDKKQIVEVSNLFNSILLPLSDIELDVILFGTYSLVAILIGIFSTLLANQISRPIRKLTGATKSVASGDLSIEINGNWKGEIKELTDGFNSMVKDLKRSQGQLAEMERESAWKEMAKQVAHEIKNPLTPMKLSIQQLMIAHDDNSPKFNSIFDKVTKTIIGQIDILKNIASEFSNFARMPSVELTTVDPKEVIQEVANLFSDEKIELETSLTSLDVKVKADLDQLKRALVNMVRNSMQAGAEKIILSLQDENDYCFIRISDDGKGIPAEVTEKIFDKDFTTKIDGMGIGLSMARRFINSINGEISVEKSSSAGTTIMLRLPKFSS